MSTITRLRVLDVRYPTSVTLDDSDAVHTDPDYVKREGKREHFVDPVVVGGVRCQLLRAPLALLLVPLLWTALAGCDTGDSWRPITRAQRAERRLDYAVHYQEREAMIRSFEQFLVNPDPEFAPEKNRSRSELRTYLRSWRDPLAQQADEHFRRLLQRAADRGSPMEIMPVRGDRFPIQTLYFRDDAFFVIDRVEERNMLLLCRVDGKEVIATATRLSWSPNVNFNDPSGGSQPIRVYVFLGFVSPDRSAHMTVKQMHACLESLADNSHRTRRRLGERELERVQQVHDFFFDVTR